MCVAGCGVCGGVYVHAESHHLLGACRECLGVIAFKVLECPTGGGLHVASGLLERHHAKVDGEAHKRLQ